MGICEIQIHINCVTWNGQHWLMQMIVNQET